MCFMGLGKLLPILLRIGIRAPFLGIKVMRVRRVVCGHIEVKKDDYEGIGRLFILPYNLFLSFTLFCLTNTIGTSESVGTPFKGQSRDVACVRHDGHRPLLCASIHILIFLSSLY